jgi:hypothetical protein
VAYIQALAKAIANQLSTIWTTGNRLPVDTGASANSVTIQDATTSANKIIVNGSGQIGVNNQPTGFATETTLGSTRTSLETRLGSVTDAPATDINSSAGLNGLLRLIGKTIDDPSNTSALATGTVKQQLRFIAENSSGGTQYDSGVSQATPRGTVTLGKNASNVLSPLSLDSSGFLRVAIASGAPNSPTEYTEGASLSTPTGVVSLGKRPDGTLNALPLSSTGLIQITAPSAIPVTITGGSSGGGSTQYVDGVTAATPTGTYAMGNKAGVAKALQIDSNNYLQVASPDITNKLGTVGDPATSTGTLLQQVRFLCDSLNRNSITSAINITSTGDTTVIGATVSKQIVITNLFFVADTTTNITFKNGATAISGAMPIISHSSDEARIILSTNTAFIINLSAIANVRGYVTYYLM